MGRKESMKNNTNGRVFTKLIGLKLSNCIKYGWQNSPVKGLNEITKPNYELFTKDISEI